MVPAQQLARKRPIAQRKPENKAPRIAAQRQEFDYESGQVYTEVEVVFRRKQNSDWIGELKTPSIAMKSTMSKSGSRSLTDIARAKCIREFRDFTPQHFEAIPWSLTAQIWAEVRSRRCESFHVWRTLAAVYNHDEEFGAPQNRYHLEIRQPPLPMKEYFRGISSPDVKWLSALRISPKQIPMTDLVAIAYITNLTVLDLSDGQLLLDTTPSRFDERIMRTWAELASSGRAFQHLRVLMLGWQDGVSNWMFKYINCFPCLHIVIATDCKNMHQKNRADWEHIATAHGWTANHAKKSVKQLRPMMDDKQFYVASVSNLYYRVQAQCGSNAHSADVHELKRLPVVECWLGTPRQWTHILDEFPGTRTIWFEKVRTGATAEVEMAAQGVGEADSTKRLRETGSLSPALLSPPHKKSQGGKGVRLRRPTESAASLLADLGR